MVPTLFLYIVAGQGSGACGGGSLWKANSKNGECSEVSPSWQNATCMAAIGNMLYIICGNQSDKTILDLVYPKI